MRKRMCQEGDQCNGHVSFIPTARHPGIISFLTQRTHRITVRGRTELYPQAFNPSPRTQSCVLPARNKCPQRPHWHPGGGGWELNFQCFALENCINGQESHREALTSGGPHLSKVLEKTSRVHTWLFEICRCYKNIHFEKLLLNNSCSLFFPSLLSFCQ